ncbi:hypothetical protein IW147_000735 [Coemansia sp. RSA 720]|nr:hypothetical protein IW147_000735 [Coemansia sp. RSA 720]
MKVAVAAAAAAIMLLVHTVTAEAMPTHRKVLQSTPPYAFPGISSAPVSMSSAIHISVAVRSAPTTTSTPAKRFSCAHEDGVSDLYYETIKKERVLFQCLMGTKCYQRANEYADIECVYPESKMQKPTASSATDIGAATPASNMFSVSSSYANFASAVYAPAQFIERPTSSEPHVLSVNIVLPTIGIRITDDPGAPDEATVISIEAATSTLTEMKVVPLFKGLGSDSPVVPSATVVNANAWPLPSAVQFGIPTPIQRMRSPNEFASISAQERRILTIDDSDLFSVMYMSNPKPQTAESILTTPAPMLLASSPPASPNTLTFTGSSPSGPAELLFTGSSPPGLAAPEFTGSSPPATPSLPPVQHKDTTELPRPVFPVSSLVIPEQKIQAQVPSTSVASPVFPVLSASSSRAVELPTPPTSTHDVNTLGTNSVQPTITLSPLFTAASSPAITPLFTVTSSLTIAPFTVAPSPAITPMPTPFVLPAALRNLLAPQAIPESVSAPLITVIFHPTYAPMPMTMTMPMAMPLPLPALLSSVPIISPLPALAPSNPIISPLPISTAPNPLLSLLSPPLPTLEPISFNLASRKDALANTPTSSAFEPIYPQNTPIIPFISDGTRQPTPTDEDESKKGAVNASGIASILQEMLHVPLEKITIDGKPVVLDDLGQVSNGGNVNVMVMNPDNQKTGSGQNVGAKGAPNDDDILDDDGPDAEPTTHSLDVDRFKHRNHALGHAHVHAHARLQKSRLSSDDDTKPKPSSNNDSDGSASDDSDSDDDSDSEIEIETETDSDDDYKIVRYTTPTKSSSSEDSTSVETPTPTRTRKKISPTMTDSSSTSSKD